MELDNDQKVALRKFQEITNIQDQEIAVGTLASLDWNLERAIESHLLNEQDNDDEQNERPEMDIVQPQPFNIRGTTSRQQPATSNNDYIDSPFNSNSSINNAAENALRTAERSSKCPKRRKRTLPARVLPSSSNNYTDSEEEIVLDDDDTSHHHDAAPSRRSHTINSDIPLIPQDSEGVYESLNNFVSVFESRYCTGGGAFMPCFSTDSLNNTMREAFEAPGREIAERRPLAIYIHNDNSVAANIFASNVMCREEICNLLRHQFVLWGWDMTFKENATKLLDLMKMLNIPPEMRHVFEGMRYNRDRYPLLILLVKEKGSLRMAELCEGPDTSERVIEKLLSCVEDYTSIRMNEMQEQRDREERERIRQEQAEEYERSLAADRARREAKEKEIREQKEEEERKIRAEEEEQQRRAQLESELPDEPAENAPDAIMIKFRVPEGEQFVRRFRNSENLGIMLKFLSSKGFTKEQHRFFNSDFPKKDVSTWDVNSTFSALKWPKREQIYVEEQ